MICVPHSPIVKHLAKDLYKYGRYTQVSHYKAKTPIAYWDPIFFFKKGEKIINNLLILFLE